MSRSTKKTPIINDNFRGSQKKWKKISHHLFRQAERRAIKAENTQLLRYHQWERVNSWILHDYHLYCGDCSQDVYNRIIRK